MPRFWPILNHWKYLAQKGLYRVFRIQWVRCWMRLGHAAKGLLYGLIGIFAVWGIIYDDERAVGGTETVLAALGDRAIGSFILAFLAVGLVGYSFWRLVQMLLDPSHPKSLNFQQVLQRLGYGVSGLTYLGIGYTSGRLAVGLTVDFDDTVEDLASVLFDLALGPWALLAIGFGVVAVGLTYIYGAFSGSFISEFQAELYSAIQRPAVIMGKIGFTARGTSFALIGVYLLKSAYYVDENEAGGLGQVLDRLDDQPFGKVWLGAIAFGFMSYASYMLIAAFYRKFPDSRPKRYEQ